MSTTKRNALLFLAGTGILVILLAMSLPTLKLFPGEPFSLGQPPPGVTGSGGSLEGGNILYWIIRGVAALTLIGLIIYVISSLMSGKGRTRLIVAVIMIAILFYVADYLHNHPLTKEEQPQPQSITGMQQLDEQDGKATTQFLANPPSWLTVAIILTASVITVAVIAAVIVIVRRRRQAPPSALDLLAEAAQNTVTAIQSGGDFKVSVIRCYQQMMQVVKEEKGIARETTMTAREFEDQLVSRGLPQDAIRTLTRLFEQVRYGGSQPTDPHDEALALSCLTDIAKACGSQWSLPAQESA